MGSMTESAVPVVRATRQRAAVSAVLEEVDDFRSAQAQNQTSV